jgi:hypothetical protein
MGKSHEVGREPGERRSLSWQSAATNSVIVKLYTKSIIKKMRGFIEKFQ